MVRRRGVNKKVDPEFWNYVEELKYEYDSKKRKGDKYSIPRTEITRRIMKDHKRMREKSRFFDLLD